MVITACDARPPEAVPAQRHTVPAGATSVDPAEDPALLRSAEMSAAPGEPHDADDPAAEGWASEARTRSIGAQLHELAAVLREARPTAQSVDGLVLEDVVCGQLRPSQMLTRRATGPFVVREGDPRAPPETAAQRGIDRCVEALRELAAGWPPELPREVAFKVTGIRQTDDVTDTDVRLEVRCGRSGARVTERAEWTASWVGEPPRLSHVRSGPLLRVEVAAPLFADETRLLADAAPWYELQSAASHDTWDERLAGTSQYDGLLGLAVGDVNGDGRDDVYVCDRSGLPNLLLVAQSDGTVRDEAAMRGLDWLNHTASALLLDLDNDGDQDLVTATRAGIVVTENDGEGKYTIRDVLSTGSAVSSLAAADIDNDGDLDIYVGVTTPGANVSLTSRGTTSSAAVGGGGRLTVIHDSRAGGRNHLFRNEGALRFVDATAETGLDVDNSRRTLSASFADIDSDGDQDLYVVNDYGRDNLFRNQGGAFDHVSEASGAEDAAFGMGVAWGDPNRDGHVDAYVSNMYSSAGLRITGQPQFKPESEVATRDRYRRMARGNTLLLNDGSGAFEDAAATAGVEIGLWSWGSVFLDLDLDGWEDLFVPNGFVTRPDKRDL